MARDQAAFFGLNFETNRCKPGTAFVWCLPKDYNQEKHPFTCRKQEQVFGFFHLKYKLSDYQLQNKSLPWDYDFKFVIDEISNINDKDQSMMISMYFAVSWMEPRLVINETAKEWTEDRTGPKDVGEES